MQGNAVSRRYCKVRVWNWNLHRNTQRSTVTPLHDAACCGYAGFCICCHLCMHSINSLLRVCVLEHS